MQTRHTLVPASCLVLIENNKILLTRRINTGFQDGNYGLVSGHGEENENFTETLMREVKEEANIDVKPEDLKVVHVMNRNEKLNPQETRERIDVFFRPKRWSGKIKNMEPEKCDDLRWFDLDDLPENIIPYVRFTIENITKNINYSEYGFKL